jgi:hypothetical protein
MFLIVELLFILLLSMVLYFLYHNERASGRKNFRHAVLEGCWTGKERRRHVRFKKRLDVSYVTRKKSQVKSSAKTSDISMGGAKLVLDEKLSKGVVLFIRMLLPETNKTVEAEGEVVWSECADSNVEDGKRFFYAGVKFVAIKSPDDGTFLEYVQSLPHSIEE